MELVSGSWRTNAILVLIALLLWGFFKIKSIYKFFEKRGIPFVKPTFLLGSDVKGALAADSMGLAFDRMYHELKGEKVGGFFLGTVPLYLVRDPDYINLLFIKHFDHFHDRPFLIDEKHNPIEGHLFFMKGSKWRFLRNKLSPTLTSGKLKYMYSEMYKCSEMLVDYMDSIEEGKDVELYEALGKFATDVIGSTAFGLEPESFKNPNSQFREMGRRFFEPSLRSTLIFFFQFAWPQLLIALKIYLTEKVISNYFRGIINNVLDYRIKTGVKRNDFIQLAIQLKEKGYIEVDNEDLAQVESTNEKNLEKLEITNDLIAAQAFVYFLAGFETTSTTMYFLIYLLSLHQDVQEKARKEAREVKKKFAGFPYDSLKELVYLDKCIAETLRLFPPVPFINRECTKDYSFPNGVTIEKGHQVLVPVFSLHRDPAYFPEPESFRPERFREVPDRGTYSPFGDGPRICFGKRLAEVEMKMTVAKLLDRYSFEESPLTVTPLRFSKTILLRPDNPLLVRIRKLTN